MARQLLMWVQLAAFATFAIGCAARAPMVDDAGRKITKEELRQRKGNENMLLFAVGGGALSFGVSFFAGSLVDRAASDDNQSLLWLTTGIGTALGIVYFANQGSSRDHNLAIGMIRDERNDGVTDRIADERARRQSIEAEKKRIEEERSKQEAERRKLLEKLNTKQKKSGNNRL